MGFKIEDLLRGQDWMDGLADRIQALVGRAYGAMGSFGPRLKSYAHGTMPLGHPLHPALTDVPLGAWVVAVIADYAAHFTSAVPTQVGDVALIVGLVVGLAAVATGYTDFHETYGMERRVGLVHGLIMSGVTALMLISVVLRWWGGPGLHPLAVAVSTVGLVAALGGAYFGGHLVFGFGTMVNRLAFAEGPDDFVEVGASDDFPENSMRLADAAGMPVLVVRLEGKLHAIANTCSHAGGPLNEGQMDAASVVCPWHGSRFSLIGGRVEGGPATFDQPLLEVAEAEGRVAVRLLKPLH